jgi:PAS domain S-box-containing protein
MPNLDHQTRESFFDAVDVGLIVVDQDCRVQAWNSWMATASGVDASSTHGQTLDDIFPGTVRPRLLSAVAEALNDGLSSILTHSLHVAIFPLKTRTGRNLLHNVAIRPIGGEPRRCLVQVTDVTMSAERDRILRDRQNARYDAVVDSAPDAILTLDAGGIIRLANRAAASELGYAPDELVGQPITLLFGDQPAWSAAWTSALDGERSRRPVEVTARRKDGSTSLVELSASRWQTDTRMFVTAILRDVNERRAAEERLRSLNQTLERRVAERTADRDRMWRMSTDVMLVARLDGTISATNPACAHLLGHDDAALPGMSLADFVSAEDRPKFAAALRDPTHAGPFLIELSMLARDGAPRRIAWNIAVADDLLQAVGRDVTAEREAEAALHRMEETLRQSQKMEALGQLTGGIAHDFNNLLAGILGAIEILKDRIAANRYDDVGKFLTAAATSAERAAALTHRLLAFARRQPLDPRPIEVNRLVKGMADLLRRSLGEQIELDIALGTNVWPTLADDNQLENALLNLAINARDAMPSGGRLTIETASVTVGASETHGQDEVAPGDYTVITIADSGVGMSHETLTRAFDPFFTTKPVGVGTGLGLSMVYGFAKQSHGYVLIDSEVGRGTTVRLYLPRYLGTIAEAEERLPVQPPQGSGEVILLVEDDAAVRLLIVDVLREFGYACLEATDGQAALPILTSDAHLDLMITDIGLPGIGGCQLAETARRHRPELKVLFVTGYAGSAMNGDEFLAAGMEMVTKPFRLDNLILRIRQMIGSAPHRLGSDLARHAITTTTYAD